MHLVTPFRPDRQGINAVAESTTPVASPRASDSAIGTVPPRNTKNLKTLIETEIATPRAVLIIEFFGTLPTADDGVPPDDDFMRTITATVAEETACNNADDSWRVATL